MCYIRVDFRLKPAWNVVKLPTFCTANLALTMSPAMYEYETLRNLLHSAKGPTRNLSNISTSSRLKSHSFSWFPQQFHFIIVYLILPHPLLNNLYKSVTSCELPFYRRKKCPPSVLSLSSFSASMCLQHLTFLLVNSFIPLNIYIFSDIMIRN